jgi:DNA-binding beta-propeller fold protein YncE
LNSLHYCLDGGVTVAGFCNATVGGGSQGLSGPWGLYVTSDNTLYVADYDVYRVQAYPSLSRFGTTIMTTTAYIQDVFVDSTLNVYTAIMSLSKVFISPSNITLPKTVSSSCNLSSLYYPYGVAVDLQGHVYISDFGCHVITKWSPNGTTGTLMFGQMNTAGSTNQLLNGPKCIFYDEIGMALYVVDYGNNRVQKFMINGNGTGITVAGGNGAGPGLNQLNGPIGVWVSQKDGSIYVGDWHNQRVMKWPVNATQGSIVAGVTGIAGNSSLLLNIPGDVALDPSETFLYVTDYANHRVQRFHL